MHFKLLRAVKRLSFIAVLPVVAACSSMVPGMRVDAAPVAAAGSAQQVAPVVKLITPDLIQAEKAASDAQVDERVRPLFGEPAPYLIGNGDLLAILVWGHPELNVAAVDSEQARSRSDSKQSAAIFVVDREGMIQFPFTGPIKVAGLSELQARKLLSDKLVASIKDPDITLRVLTYRSKKIYVDGEVKAPGAQPIDDVPMTLLEGISRAGGFLPRADQSQVVVSRKGTNYTVNLPALLRHGVDVSRLMLADGDVVRVPSRDENKVFVLGEVNRPQALPMHNGKLTLAAALGEAGGLNQMSAAARQVYVIRNSKDAQPLVFNLDAASPVALALAENFDLSPNDVVFVDASGLARFSRILRLVLPIAPTSESSAVTVTQ